MAFGETAVVGIGENVSEGNDTVLGHTTWTHSKYRMYNVHTMHYKFCIYNIQAYVYVYAHIIRWYLIQPI